MRRVGVIAAAVVMSVVVVGCIPPDPPPASTTTTTVFPGSCKTELAAVKTAIAAAFTANQVNTVPEDPGDYLDPSEYRFIGWDGPLNAWYPTWLDVDYVYGVSKAACGFVDPPI